jgi:hypothetical protein
MNRTVRESMRVHYQRLLDQGNFPEVGWRRGAVYNYNTNEYLILWGRMAHLVDKALKGRGYHLGCYEMRRSDDFRKDTIQIISAIDPQDVIECQVMCGVPGQCR